jgi:hypothetical protein
MLTAIFKILPMPRFFLLIIAFLALTTTLPLAASEAAENAGEESAWAIDHWRVAFSFYTHHFDPDPDHNNDQNLIGVETHFNNAWFAGAAVFDNSFGQPSQFVFMGKSWQIMGSEHWYFKLMGGLLHGYKEPYEDKIPLNGLGVAPAIVPALGYKYRRVFVEANIGGLAVVTMTAGFSF